MMYRSTFTEGMKKNQYEWFFEKYDLTKPTLTEIASPETFDGAYTIETAAVGMGDINRKAEGAKFESDDALEGYSVVKNKVSWGKTFKISKEAVDDHRVKDIVKKMAAGWADALKRRKETLVADLFNYGGYTAGYHDVFDNSTSVMTTSYGDLCYDGKPFFNLTGNTRESIGGGTYYNGHALAFSQTNLEIVYNHMVSTNNRNERDQIVDITPDICVFPSVLRFSARRVLESELENWTANNAKNVVRDLVVPVYSQYLTDPNAWALGCKGKGIWFCDGGEPELDFWEDKETKSYMASIYWRGNAGVDNWRYWSGSNFPTAA